MGRYARWQTIIAIFGLMLLAAYLSSATIVQTAADPVTQPQIYREGLVGGPQYLNPLLASRNPVDQDITALIFEGLTRQVTIGQYEPQLARSWVVSDDGLVYTFTLRDDVQWSDGAPFSGQDVLFTLRLIQDPQFPGDPSWHQLWQQVAIELTDEYTIRFTLDEPRPEFLAFTTIGIVPRHLLQNTAADGLLRHRFNLSPVGTGPFMLNSATARTVRLEPNPYYHGSAPQLDGVTFRLFRSEDQLYAAFTEQAIDGIGRASINMLRALEPQPDVEIYTSPLPHYVALYFNLQQSDSLPFFQQADVRRALAITLDQAALINQTMAGAALPAQGPMLFWHWAHNPNLAYPDYDPAAATMLLDTAGYVDQNGDGIREGDNVPLRFTLLVSDDPIKRTVATWIQAQWQRVGVVVNVEVVGADFAERLTGRDFDVALVEVSMVNTPDPYPLWHQTQMQTGQNFAGWDDTPASLALEAGRLALKQQDRLEPYYVFQDRFATEMPAIVLYHPLHITLMHDWVQAVQMPFINNPADRFYGVTAWTVRQFDSTPN